MILGGTCQHAFTQLVYFVSEGKSGGRIEARETYLMNVKTAFFFVAKTVTMKVF